jgi:tripartite-type tricarboxylate transporter receptor subunit TctC
MMAGVDMVHLPYRGGTPALTDMLGGQVQVYFGPAPESLTKRVSGSASAHQATPPEIVDKLNKEINGALADHKIKGRLADLGSTPVVGSATDFGKLIADETEKWGNVIRALNIKAE